MTRKRRTAPIEFGVASLLCAAAMIAYFLASPPPDLMARATMIHDFGSPVEYDGFQWMDKSNLIATSVPSTRLPSVISINLDSKTIALLPRVTRALKEIMAKFHSDELTDAIPSPDGKWIVFCFSLQPPAIACVSCAIRIKDGHTVVAPKPIWGNRIFWLTDSQRWVVIDADALVTHSLNVAKTDRIFPAAGIYEKATNDDDGMRKVDAVLGHDRVFVPRRYRSRRSFDEDGVVSPDGKRVVWLHESVWPEGLPFKLRPMLTACGYRPRMHGEVWTTCIDGTDRHEVGAFDDHSPFPIDEWNFDWTPDGKALIFTRGGVLYSVPEP